MTIQKLKLLFEEISDPYPRVRGDCIQCGKCCRSLILTRKGQPVYEMRDFEILMRQDKKTYHRFYPDEEQSEGFPLTFSCIYQKGNLCSDHENRPKLCRTYPHRSIFKLGAELEEGCGYRIVQKGDFEDILDKKMKGPQK